MKDLAGEKFNRLLVLEFAFTRDRRRFWKCKCDCGNIKYIYTNQLISGETKSCGCYRREKMNRTTHGEGAHGKITREYSAWSKMKRRCSDSGDKAKRYKNRGISVCEKWISSYENFLSDMGRCPQGFTLDRIDNDKGYEPLNCRWASMKQQSNNRSSNRIITYNSISKTLTQWAEIIGRSTSTLSEALSKNPEALNHYLRNNNAY